MKKDRKKNRKTDAKADRKRKKKNTIILASVLVVAAFIIVFFILFNKHPVMAKVNDYQIRQEELQLFMDIYKSEAASNLKKTYDVTLSSQTYEEKAGDKTALQYWKDYAFERLLRYKIEQQLAVKQGILNFQDISFSSFQRTYEEENNRRNSAIQRGEVVYGARQYTIQSYYRYQYSNLQIDLMDKLFTDGGELDVKKKQLEEYYLAHKEDYKEIDSYVFTQYVCKEAADLIENQQEEIYEAIQKGQKGLDVLNKYDIEKNQIELNQENYRSLSKEAPDIYEIARNMKEGEVSDFLSYKDSFMILKCEVRKEGGYGEFDEYQEEIKANYKRETYEQYIDTLVQEAHVKLSKRYINYKPQ